DDDQEGPSAGSDRGSKIQKEGGEHASASTPSKTATGSAGRTTKGSQSRQLSASESAFTEEPVQTTCQMEEPPHLVFKTGADDQPIVQTSQHPEWFSQPRRPPSPDLNRESALDVYSKRRIIAITELKIVEWHDYKHLDWISVRRDDDIFTNLKKVILKGYASKTLKICCYSWSIVIQRRVEVLQLGVESVSLEKSNKNVIGLRILTFNLSMSV
nr:hypothetical protein [Tanacetum cinerariifolium]